MWTLQSGLTEARGYISTGEDVLNRAIRAAFITTLSSLSLKTLQACACYSQVTACPFGRKCTNIRGSCVDDRDGPTKYGGGLSRCNLPKRIYFSEREWSSVRDPFGKNCTLSQNKALEDAGVRLQLVLMASPSRCLWIKVLQSIDLHSCTHDLSKTLSSRRCYFRRPAHVKNQSAGPRWAAKARRLLLACVRLLRMRQQLPSWVDRSRQGLARIPWRHWNSVPAGEELALIRTRNYEPSLALSLSGGPR